MLQALEQSCEPWRLVVPQVSYELSAWWRKRFQACVARFTKRYKDADFKINTWKRLWSFTGLCCVDPHSPSSSPWIAIIMFINYLWNGFQAEADWLYSGYQQAFWAGTEPPGQTSRAPHAFTFRRHPSAQAHAIQTDKWWQARASHNEQYLTV